MNTRAVSKILGVSASTVQRWVKHLDMEMERNEFGHYLYTDEDIEILKEFKKQVQQGIPIQEIKVEKKPRKGKVKVENKDHDMLMKRLQELEKKLEEKADSVVTYQLLQHRSELEEIQKKTEKMMAQIDQITSRLENLEARELEQPKKEKEGKKKKSFFQTIFGM